MGIVSLLFFLLMFSQEKSLTTSEKMLLFTILIVLSSVIVLEMVIKLIILGLKTFITYYFYVYELMTSFLLFICLLWYLLRNSEGEGINIKLINAFILLRIIRVFYLLLEINSLKAVFQSLFTFIPFMLDHLAALFTFYCFFAVLGIHIFGGLLNTHVILTFNGNSYADYYYYSNFNDFLGALLILFSLMIVNNWNNQVKLKFIRIFHFIIILSK